MEFQKIVRSDRFRFCLLFVVVILTRLPFLDAGYGVHVDSWRIANTARHISETGEYVVSRFPGYPVQEIACSLLWRGGPVALNGASAIFSAIAVVFFGLILREMQCRDYMVASLALAFAPVVYVNSVTSKDYIWALAFILACLYSILKGRPVLAGVCLGLAIGSRLTSGVVALPFSLIIAGLNREARPARKILLFAAASAIVATMAFLPVILKYHAGFFTFYDQAYPDWRTILARGTVEMWGILGVGGFAIALGGIIWRIWLCPSPPPFSCASYHVFSWVVLILIYLAVYLRLPHHAAYLIPLMPFVLLVLARYCPRRIFQFVCVLSMAGSFFTVGASGFSTGAIFKDRTERFEITANINGFLAFTKKMPGKNTFVVGGWEPEITNISPASQHPSNTYVYLLTAQDVLRCIQSGTTIYCTAAMRQFNYRVYGIDLAKYGAKDIRAIYENQMETQAQSAGHQ